MSSGHQRITWRKNIAENFNRLSRVHERYRQTTDRRQTTDGRTTTYSEHEQHEFTFAKNEIRVPPRNKKLATNREIFRFPSEPMRLCVSSGLLHVSYRLQHTVIIIGSEKS